MTGAAPIRLRVPATSANLGPGFDCLGLALDLHLEVEARPAERDRFSYEGEGMVPDSPDNLIHRGFAAACGELGVSPEPLAVVARNPIPLARGLGSSSAALVAGAAIADALHHGMLGRDGVFALAARIEGHPDNVAPAVYGGFTASAADERGRYLTRSLPVPSRWRLLFGVPASELPTEVARSLLPESYLREDTVRTASRAALWCLAVARDEPELLRIACLDVVHEPYRAPLLPGFTRLRETALERGAWAVYLSGAGPTMGAVVAESHEEEVREVLDEYAGSGGQVLALAPGGGYEVLTPHRHDGEAAAAEALTAVRE